MRCFFWLQIFFEKRGWNSNVHRQEYTLEAISKYKTNCTDLTVCASIVAGILPRGDLVRTFRRSRSVGLTFGLLWRTGAVTQRLRRILQLRGTVVCINCHAFAVDGVCTHTYTAMLDCGLLDQKVPWQPFSKKRRIGQKVVTPSHDNETIPCRLGSDFCQLGVRSVFVFLKLY